MPQHSALALSTRANETLKACYNIGVQIRGTLEDIDPLNKVRFKRAIGKVNKYPL